MDAAVKAAKGRCKLIVHVGANCTDDSVVLAKHAAKVGIDWISSITPQLYRNSFDAAYYHYKTITAATDLPFMVYSMGSTLIPERDIRFFDLKNVKGIKYTGRDCGAYRNPFEPLTAAQYKAYAKRFAKLGIVKAGQAK